LIYDPEIFDEVFSGYQPRWVSVLNRRFEDHLDHRHGSDVETSVQYRLPDAADIPRKLHLTVFLLLTVAQNSTYAYDKSCYIKKIHLYLETHVQIDIVC